jgi:PD-(D/E)XK nuclease superfamily
MANTIEEWTNSALMKLERCGEAFRRRYIEGEVIPPSPRMLRGTVVHRIAADALRRKLFTKTLPALEEVRDYAADEFEAQWAGGVSFYDEQPEGGAIVEKARSKDFSIDLSTFYVGSIAPRIDPIAVERRIRVRPRDSDIVISGGVDLIAREAPAKPDGLATEVIRDTKTTERTPRANAAEVSQQLTMYAMIRHAEIGSLPSRLTLDHLVQTPAARTVRHVPLVTTRTHDDVAALVRRLNTAVHAVERGVFMPAPPDAWYCSPKWCEYYASCVYVRRGVTRPQA